MGKYTALVALLFIPGLVAAESNIPEFKSNYSKARQISRETSKPLAVFISSGHKGWEDICPNGITQETKQLLADNYVCVYLNRAEIDGAKLADEFEVKNTGIIISNRTGTLQAFRHNGTLQDTALNQQLKKFADPTVVINHTETVGRPALQIQPVQYQPIYYPQFGAGCANGQ